MVLAMTGPPGKVGGKSRPPVQVPGGLGRDAPPRWRVITSPGPSRHHQAGSGRLRDPHLAWPAGLEKPAPKMWIANGRNRASMISGMRLLASKQAVDARGNDMARRPSNLKKDLTTKIDTLDIFHPRLATRQGVGRSKWWVGS
jgi:hypothetical protein